MVPASILDYIVASSLNNGLNQKLFVCQSWDIVLFNCEDVSISNKQEEIVLAAAESNWCSSLLKKK